MPEGDDTVTFLLTDIEGSTRNWESSPDAMRAALARHDEILNRLLREHHGDVRTERGEGDSFFALFPTASDAVAAASALQRVLQAEKWPAAAPIRVRMAIHTGEAGEDHRGPEVNRCARLRAVAHGGQVLLSAPAAALARPHLPKGASLQDLGLHRLRDLTEPEHVFELDHIDLPAAFPPLRSLDARKHNLPIQLTSFIGRAAELQTVKELLQANRLVTLTGSGGAGKTRLALQAAAEQLESFADGVWLVDLAPLADSAFVPAAAASAVQVAQVPGVPLDETIGAQLADRDLLIVLDNCEHVIDAASALAERILRSAPSVRILATSQEALNVAGEGAWRVPSLALPDPEAATTVEALAQVEAVELFCARAVAHQAAFSLNEGNATAVARICARLDGMPLALELAAARVKVLAPDEIAGRLEDRFRLLTGGPRTALARQQTLRAAVEWSHELLTEPERVLFRRVSVFAGSFDLDACEAVCRGATLQDLDLVDLLARLADKSLVVAEREEDGAVRYRMLETLRQFGRQQLVKSGEDRESAGAQLRYFLDLAERAYAGRFEDSAGWLARLERELDNLRAALDWSRETDRDAELALAGALGWFWYLHSQHISEGAVRLAHALKDREERTAEVGRALTGAAMAQSWSGDLAAARSSAERSLSIWRELGNELEIGLALEALGWAAFFAGDEDAALAAMQEWVAIMRPLGNRRLLNRATVGLGQVLVARGDVDAVVPLATESLAVGRELGEVRDVHYSLHFLGDCALYRHNGVDAERWYALSLAAALEYGNVVEGALEMEGLSMGLTVQGRTAKAMRLEGAAAAKMAELGFDASSVAFWQRFKERYLRPARESLGEAAADALEGEGRAMGFAKAVEYARDVAAD